MKHTLCALVLLGFALIACDDNSSNNVNNSNNINNTNNTSSNNTNNLNNTNNVNNTNTINNTTTHPPRYGCEALPAPSGPTITVSPAQADQLRGIIEGAAPGTTILFEDGLYDMSQGDSTSRLVVATDNITLRSLSGQREAVILDGGYITGELISIYANNVTVADLTLTKAYYHPIHVSGPDGSPIEGTLIHNVHIIDPGEQAIKINPNGTGWTDRGVVRCSLLEMTDSGRAEVRNNCYTGGVDAHKSQGWVIHSNTITGFWCETGLSEHAIHMWQACRDTIVANNTIIDCARGIGFGMGESGDGREYTDDPYPELSYVGHFDGVIFNNFISASDSRLFASASGFDAGITLEQAHGSWVYHNSVVSTEAPFSSIEWRWDNTSVHLYNNLVSHNLRDRGGVNERAGNVEDAPLTWFSNVSSGDLHLTTAASPPAAGSLITRDDYYSWDIDGDERANGSVPGADLP